MEHHACICVAGEHAVEDGDVEVDVQVDRAPHPLNKIDGTALRVLDSPTLGARPVAREDRLDEDASQRRQHVRLERGEPAQLVRQRQDVLAHGHVGRQNSVDQVCGRVCHAPSATTWANAAAATRERDEQIVATRIAVAANKARREHPADQESA